VETVLQVGRGSRSLVCNKTGDFFISTANAVHHRGQLEKRHDTLNIIRPWRINDREDPCEIVARLKADLQGRSA